MQNQCFYGMNKDFFFTLRVRKVIKYDFHQQYVSDNWIHINDLVYHKYVVEYANDLKMNESYPPTLI